MRNVRTIFLMISQKFWTYCCSLEILMSKPWSYRLWRRNSCLSNRRMRFIKALSPILVGKVESISCLAPKIFCLHSRMAMKKWWFQGLNNNLFCHLVNRTRWQDVQVGDVSTVSKKLSIGLQMAVDYCAIAWNCVAFLQESRSFQKKSKFNKTTFSHSFLSNIDIIGNLWWISREDSFLFVDNWSILQVSWHSSVQEYFLNRSCKGFRYKSVTALRFPEVVLVGNW